MPKLLQKNILKSSVAAFLFAMGAFLCIRFWVKNEYSFLFYVNLALALMCNPEMTSVWGMFQLPDYLYLAPYSRDQRKNLLRKGQIYQFLAVYIWFLVLLLLPPMIVACRRGNTADLLLWLTEFILTASILYTNRMLKFMGQLDHMKMAVIEVVRILLISLFSGCMDLASATGADRMIGLVTIACCVGFSIFLMVHCRWKYYDRMINSMADYEYMHQEQKK